RMDAQPTAWFASPFDVAAADDTGMATFFLPGEAKVGAMIGGKPGFATITIKPQRIARIDIAPIASPIAVGGGVKLAAVARTSNGDPQGDAGVEWTSSAPAVAAIDPAGLITGVAVGQARITARNGSASASIDVTVIANPVKTLSVAPRTARARTGDVVHFSATATGAHLPAVRWSVTGEGAAIEPDGAFVAERAGTYTITASCGDK